MPGTERRAEADDAWLADRRSSVMTRLRRRLRIFGGVANAVSHADTGPYAGAPRDPSLDVDGDRAYSFVRYSTSSIAYTTTSAQSERCDGCGADLAERRVIGSVRDGDTHPLGSVRVCPACQADSWLRRSRMPRAERARTIARRNVL